MGKLFPEKKKPNLYAYEECAEVILKYDKLILINNWMESNKLVELKDDYDKLKASERKTESEGTNFAGKWYRYLLPIYKKLASIVNPYLYLAFQLTDYEKYYLYTREIVEIDSDLANNKLPEVSAIELPPEFYLGQFKIDKFICLYENDEDEEDEEEKDLTTEEETVYSYLKEYCKGRCWLESDEDDKKVGEMVFSNKKLERELKDMEPPSKNKFKRELKGLETNLMYYYSSYGASNPNGYYTQKEMVPPKKQKRGGSKPQKVPAYQDY